MLQRITTTPTISLSCIRKADDPVFTKYPTWGFEVGEILRYSYYTIIEEFGL